MGESSFDKEKKGQNKGSWPPIANHLIVAFIYLKIRHSICHKLIISG